MSGVDRSWGPPASYSVAIKGSYRTIKEVKNGWIHIFTPPYALVVYHRPTFNFTFSYVHICCLLSKNRIIKTLKSSCAFTCVQVGPSHYVKNLRRRGFHKRVLRKIFGPKREEVTGDRSLCLMRSFKISLLLTKYHPGNQIKDNLMGGPCSIGEKRNAYRVSVLAWK